MGKLNGCLWLLWAPCTGDIFISSVMIQSFIQDPSKKKCVTGNLRGLWYKYFIEVGHQLHMVPQKSTSHKSICWQPMPNCNNTMWLFTTTTKWANDTKRLVPHFFWMMKEKKNDCGILYRWERKINNCVFSLLGLDEWESKATVLSPGTTDHNVFKIWKYAWCVWLKGYQHESLQL